MLGRSAGEEPTAEFVLPIDVALIVVIRFVVIIVIVRILLLLVLLLETKFVNAVMQKDSM